MLRLLADNDLNQKLLRGLRQRIPNIDVITARSIGLKEATDPELLEWAANADRIIITHDNRTMPAHVSNRIAAGARVAGVVIIPQPSPIPRAIAELEIIVMCSIEADWENPILHIPL